MITLHGFASSNYYNIVKHALLYKGISFDERLIYSGGEEWLEISPANMVPAITTEEGQHLSETAVICDFLEENYPEVPLYPSDPGQRAAVRQIMRLSELYLELPCRSLLTYLFTGTEIPAAVQEEVRPVIERGIEAMKRVCLFSPWIAGDQQTMADIYVLHANTVVTIGASALKWDVLAEISGMKEWEEKMNDSDIARSIQVDQETNRPSFEAYIAELYSA